MSHSKIDNTFNGAQDQLTALSSVFREDGKLAAECSDDCDLSQVRSAFESLISAMREAHTEATMDESVQTEGTKGCADCEYMKAETDGEVDTCDECAAEKREAQVAEAPDYNPAAGEYASNREYGMFTDQGNAEVAEIVDDIERNYEAGEFDSPEAAVDSAMNDLENLSNDNKSFEEAGDTDVRNQVTHEILSRLRDTGFDESLNHMKKLAGLQQ